MSHGRESSEQRGEWELEGRDGAEGEGSSENLAEGKAALVERDALSLAFSAPSPGPGPAHASASTAGDEEGESSA